MLLHEQYHKRERMRESKGAPMPYICVHNNVVHLKWQVIDIDTCVMLPPPEYQE